MRHPLTHEFLAVMLGVQRPGVALALRNLERCGVIKATRSKITVIDREGLLGLTNGSYGTPESEMKRLVGKRANQSNISLTIAAEPAPPWHSGGTQVMRDLNKSEEVQMARTVADSFVRRPRLPFDDLLGEGVPQEPIDLVLEMRRLERERAREAA